MPRDERKRLQVSIGEDGLATVEGETEPFRRMQRRAWFDISDFVLNCSIVREDGVAKDEPMLCARARLDKDRLATAGWRDELRGTIPATIRQFTLGETPLGDTRTPWSAIVGFSPGDWEFASKDEWFLEISLPREALDRMVEAYRMGELKRLVVGGYMSFWTPDYERHTPIGYGMSIYLLPDMRWGESSVSPGNACGEIDSIRWSDQTKQEPEPDPPSALANIDGLDAPLDTATVLAGEIALLRKEVSGFASGAVTGIYFLMFMIIINALIYWFVRLIT
jgi:hypothetical protein